ncbi:MAG: hypothetical protein OS130_04570 [Thermodesulfobacteriota bacterium]|nr:MAG: hypothetical protein OS130_04570 [Thermodesulfobacteriota bacterium]
MKQYNLDFNILKAQITPEEAGLLVLELKGDDNFFRGNPIFKKLRGGDSTVRQGYYS